MPVTSKPRGKPATRRRILQAAFDKVYRNSFRSASVDDILSATGLTKGAFYHHFRSKKELGLALVDEVLYRNVEEFWGGAFQRHEDPVTAMLEAGAGIGADLRRLARKFGCPLNNLAQEMSHVDEEFRRSINRVYRLWRRLVAEALETGQRRGTVRPEIDAWQTGAFLIAAIEGCIGLAKNARSEQILQDCRKALEEYIRGLRA